MRVLVSGSSGLIGSALVRVLRSGGDEVFRLVRHDKSADDEVRWDPQGGRAPELGDIEGIDVVVHLGGAGIGDHRWTDAYKQQILRSRVDSTSLLANTIAHLDPLPRVFLSASGVGYYGDTGDTEVDENSPAGNDFLAHVCQEWEAATAPAAQAGVRTVLLRNGVVLSTKGGALGKVLPLFRAGLGGRLGTGRQYVSWIARPDHIAAMRFLMNADDISGAVNVTTPTPVTNAAYTKAIAVAVRRPALFFAPTPALKVALGGFAETIVTGQRVLPRRLLAAGFSYGYPEIDDALRALIEANA